MKTPRSVILCRRPKEEELRQLSRRASGCHDGLQPKPAHLYAKYRITKNEPTFLKLGAYNRQRLSFALMTGPLPCAKLQMACLHSSGSFPVVADQGIVG